MQVRYNRNSKNLESLDGQVVTTEEGYKMKELIELELAIAAIKKWPFYKRIYYWFKYPKMKMKV